MRAGIIVIIIGVVLFIPLQILLTSFGLPLLYSFGIVFFLIIFGIIATVRSSKKFKKEENFAAESLKYQKEEYNEEKSISKKDDKSWEGI